MATLNKKKVSTPVYNNEGTRVKKLTPLQELHRAVLSTFLWEDGCYEDGASFVDRVSLLIPKVKPEDVAALAIRARNEFKLRHIPLFIVREMVRHEKHRPLVSFVINEIIQRPDELTELIAIYWKDGRRMIPKQMKKGLSQAFTKFDEHALSKYNRDNEIKLRDVLFLIHAKPIDKKQDKLWKRLINDELKTPDTWEVELSQSKDKKASWTRLLAENKLGGLAFLRNLRNISQAGIERSVVREYFKTANFNKVLPFRFIAASIHAPEFEPELEKAMLKSLDTLDKLKGKTALIIDTSPSMWMDKVSAKSEMTRFDAAAALAILARGICDDIDIYAFNIKSYSIPPRQGFALKDALAKTKGGASCGGLAVAEANKNGYDRIIVLSDGQWHYPKEGSSFYTSDDPIKVSPHPLTDKAYMINVSNTKNGVGYGRWTNINGFSESVINYIQSIESCSF